jgi:hypothetical protein
MFGIKMLSFTFLQKNAEKKISAVKIYTLGR